MHATPACPKTCLLGSFLASTWLQSVDFDGNWMKVKFLASSDICHFFYTNITHNIMQIILMMRLVLIMMTLAMMMTVLVIMMLVVTTCHRE